MFLTSQPTLVDECKQNKTKNNSYKEKSNQIFLGSGLHYWFIHINNKFLKRADICSINDVFKKQLPYSFLWFMSQCCRILDCPPSKMYYELIQVENKLSLLLQEDKTSDEAELEDSFSNLTL